MNKGMTIVLSFTAGMAAGIFTGKKMLEQHYEQKVEEEIESVKEAFRRYSNQPANPKKKDINSVISILHQLGIPSADGFTITGADETWKQLIGDYPNLDMVRSYVYLKVKLYQYAKPSALK